MKKVLSIILTLAMLFALTSCGDEGTTQTAETPITLDYSKIQVCYNSVNMNYYPDDHKELVEDLTRGFNYTQLSVIVANVDYLPSDFDGIDYTEYNPLSMEFDMLDFSIEEIALRVEKLSAIPGVRSVICTYDYGRPVAWDE